MLRIIILTLWLSLPYVAAFGSDHKCITIDGVEYCQTEKVKVGNITLHVTDPFALLDAAEETQVNQFQKISLWNHYEYPPFIKELAKQNNMKPQVLIDLLAKEDKMWNSLKELEAIYDQVEKQYDKYIVETVIKNIIAEIINDIVKQLGGKYA